MGRSVGNYGILIDLHRMRYLRMALLCGKSDVGLRDSRVLICRRDIPNVQTGEFGADMKVSLVNDGPFTIILE